MRKSLLSFLAPILLAGLCAGGAPAQAQAATVEAALQEWEGASSGDDNVRAAALAKLAAFDDPRVTGVLLGELERAGLQPYAVRVLQAISRMPRGDVIGPLRAALEHEHATAAVQRAAAAAIARQGHRGIDLLLDLARADGTDRNLRGACLEGLAAARDDRAWRGLASLALQGTIQEQQHVLRLLEPVRDVAAVQQVRLKQLQNSDALVAAMAWRQLAVSGHDRARDAFDDLVERLGSSPPPPVRAELVVGLAAVITAEHYDRFVSLAALENATVRTALRRVAPDLAQDAAFVRWLITDVLERDAPADRDLALLVLRSAPAAALQPLLDRVRKDLRSSRKSFDLAIGLHELLAKDPSWKNDLLQLARDGDAVTRTTALALLLELGAGDAVALAQKDVDAREWELRSIAYRYLTRFRELASIPILIARCDKEHGRLDAELNDALFVHTGVRRWQRAEWEAWWRKHKDGHELPAWESVRTATAKSGGGGSTVAYYGIPLASHRASFLIDVSGSMAAKVGTDRKRSRLDEARRQLRLAIEKLPDDHQFNVIAFESDLAPVWDALRKAQDGNKQEALQKIDKLQPRGGTNIHDALELAFKDPDVDTIYLLTDGEPTAGRIIDAQELADQVRRWNYQRQIVVHCISVGTDSVLLKRLAQESGGQYVYVR